MSIVVQQTIRPIALTLLSVCCRAPVGSGAHPGAPLGYCTSRPSLHARLPGPCVRYRSPMESSTAVGLQVNPSPSYPCHSSQCFSMAKKDKAR